MVERTYDPVRIPTVTLSETELQELQDQIELGTLPPDFIQRHFEAVEANVFGHDHKKDANGRPIEQGLGSASNMTQQSIDAYRKWAKYSGESEDEIARNLAKMQKQLAATNERKKAEAAANPKRWAARR